MGGSSTTDAPIEEQGIGYAEEVGRLAGYPRADGSEDARYPGTASWVRDRPAHRADKRTAVAGQLRDALPGPVEARTRGRHLVDVGHVEQQSPREILPVDQSGPEGARAWSTRLGTDNRNSRPIPDGRARVLTARGAPLARDPSLRHEVADADRPRSDDACIDAPK